MINNNYIINGAGVLLIERYVNRYNVSDYAFILFKDSRKGKYFEAGGHMELGESIQETAFQELKEESANLFRINPSYSTNIVIHNNYAVFPLFVVGPTYNMGGIYSKYYKYNLALLHQNPDTPDDFLETINMKRFYISDLVKCGILNNLNMNITSDLICNDANGKAEIISNRTVNIIRQTIRLGIVEVNTNNFEPITIHLPLITLNLNSYYVPIAHTGRDFLIGTVAYYA